MAARRILCDVVIADPMSAKFVQVCNLLSSRFYGAGGCLGERAYADTYLGNEFTPLAVEMYGCLDQPFVDIFCLCPRETRAPSSPGGALSISTPMAFYLQRVSVAL